jgi:hypothetical protein
MSESRRVVKHGPMDGGLEKDARLDCAIVNF